ncbi:HAD-IIIA family hydrolase [Patescibacteria group bacterium]|nr:HAD-IIIA family hydrolase [Patescibacteria group bacterium]
MDVDGVLTDGKLYLDIDGAKEIKTFHVRDGMGLLLAREAGIKTAFLSGRNSEAVRKRGEELHVDYIILGSKDKEGDLQKVLSKEGLELSNVCFVGDDIVDLPLLRKVGFSAAPQDAAPVVQKHVDYLSDKNGGEGVVRDIVEFILKRKMGFKEVTERLFEIEEDLGLFERKIAGEAFWELVRSSTRRKILGETEIFSRKEAPGKRARGYFMRVALHVAANTLLRNPFLAPRADILFFGMNRRRLQEDGLWHDIWCDPIIEQLEREGMRCAMLERPPFGRPVPKHVKTRRLSYFDFLELCFMLVRRLGLVRVRLIEEERAFLSKLQERFKEEFGTCPNLQLQVTQELEKERILSWLYRALLWKVSPKAVVAVDLSAKRQLVKACRKAGISLIELQQGAINRYNLEYSYEGPRRKKERVPDYFFAFGDFWTQQVAFSLPPERVLSVGFPYYEQELARYKNVAKKKQILFLSNSMYGRDMSKFAAELVKELKEPWHVVYKLHPEEADGWQQRYPWLVDSGVEVMRDEKKPLYYLFAESQVQVGVSSTAVYEGLGFGLFTYLLPLAGIEEMERLLEGGYARLVSSSQEMRDLLATQESTHPSGASTEFFKRNSLERMVGLVKDIAPLE